LIGTALALIDYDDLFMRTVVAVAGWALAFVFLRLIPREELAILQRIVVARRAQSPTKG